MAFLKTGFELDPNGHGGDKFNCAMRALLSFPSTMFKRQQRGAVEACWAHNPEVGGSKPLAANFCALVDTKHL